MLIGQPILGNIEHMSHYMNLYQANSKIFLTQFATYPNVGVTSHSALDMESEQHRPRQSPLVVATCMMKDYHLMLNHLNSCHNSHHNLIIINKIMGTIRSSAVQAEKTL